MKISFVEPTVALLREQAKAKAATPAGAAPVAIQPPIVATITPEGEDGTVLMINAALKSNARRRALVR